MVNGTLTNFSAVTATGQFHKSSSTTAFATRRNSCICLNKPMISLPALAVRTVTPIQQLLRPHFHWALQARHRFRRSQFNKDFSSSICPISSLHSGALSPMPINTSEGRQDGSSNPFSVRSIVIKHVISLKICRGVQVANIPGQKNLWHGHQLIPMTFSAELDCSDFLTLMHQPKAP